MWLKSRSSEKEPAPTKLGGSLTGCDGARSISITILAPIADSEGDGQAGRRPCRSLEELKKKIKRQGMKFATLRPESISADLAALYLSVKRSQAL